MTNEGKSTETDEKRKGREIWIVVQKRVRKKIERLERKRWCDKDNKCKRKSKRRRQRKRNKTESEKEKERERDIVAKCQEIQIELVSQLESERERD